MNFSFGIVTDGNSEDRINRIITSIESTMQNDDYEVIIIGGKQISRKKTKVIEFEEEIPANVSRKKNIITDISKFENVVYLHDYIEFSKDWYQQFKIFGNDFDVCMNKILNIDYSRYRDWCLWMDDAKGYVGDNNYLIPYEIEHLTGMMYISGAYWVAKKKFMQENKLNEHLKWGQGEDVEWSIRVRELTKFKINQKSSVRLIKAKDRIFNEVTNSDIENLLRIKEYKNPEAYKNLIKNHLYRWIN